MFAHITGVAIDHIAAHLPSEMRQKLQRMCPSAEAPRHAPDEMMTSPPWTLVRSRCPNAVVRSYAEFRAKFPDANAHDAVGVETFFELTTGPLQIVAAR